LQIGAPPSDPPSDLQHTLLTLTDVQFLGMAGSIDQAATKRFSSLGNKYDACVRKSYGGFEKELDKLKRADLDWSTRSLRAEAAHEKWRKRVDARCKPHVDAAENALVDLIDERNAARRKLGPKAKFARARRATPRPE
jgi:hypothetical protein